ncbi:MAG: hypothetical protein JWM68_1294 [Verrucomicrobiales bacterium]|nr:hypothetical protein [Verrucomicrobiales bacterium]
MRITANRSLGGLQNESGIALIECLVYFALLFVIIGLAFTAYERTQLTSLQLKKNTEDIVASLRAGERWRDDIRAATNDPSIEKETVHIQQTSGEVIYVFREGTVLRRGVSSPQWTPVLRGVKTSSMIQDVGSNVTSWRWELELKTKEKSPRVKPLFTFQAVAAVQVK